MKKIILVLIALTFSNVFSQSGWVRYETPALFVRLQFINSMTGFGTDPTNAYRTTNGGVNWTRMSSIYHPNDFPLEIYFLNQDTGFILFTGPFVKTTDGGSTWTYNFDFFPNGIKFINAQTGFCCGSGGIKKTTDQGNSWNNSLLSETGYISKLFFIGSNTGYACGKISNQGKVFKTTNSGDNWIDMPMNISTASMLDIKFANENTGFVTGNDSNGPVILKTTDGAISWARKGADIPENYSLFLSVPDPNTIYTVGTAKMYKSTNGGDNFSIIYQGGVLKTQYFLNPTTGFLCGGIDTAKFILKTTTGGVGIQNIGTAIPDNFYLEQNYPNPFNPNTNIEFSLPQKTFVKLKVFDLLGREIANLVNENLSAGKYIYDFTALSLPSGIYFYKLETENFSETRKMILVK